MKTTARRLGICRSVRCTTAGSGPLEIYDGPGKYCPNCGELLQPYEAPPPPRPPASKARPPAAKAPPPAAKAPPCAPEAAPPAAGADARSDEPPQVRPISEPTPPKAATPPLRAATAAAALARASRRRTAIIVGSILAIVVLAVVAAVHLTSPRTAAAAPTTVGICGSSITDQVARDLLAGYVARNAEATDHFALRGDNCDIHVFAALSATPHAGANPAFGKKFAAANTLIGHDAIVAIVNPANPIFSLSMDQLKSVLTGGTRNWSSLHGLNEPISVYMPDGATDESRIALSAIVKGASLASDVTRVGSSADVVRAVTAANGRNRIGIVAFSAAVPGKVLTIRSFPAPSIVSIGNGQYPLALGLAVNAWQIHDRLVANLFAYTTSDDAKAIIARDGLFP